ncbi:MAG: DUF1207 domain-containing protein [Planctomycetales bacterium]|nr:DUF1207 domain-containing protein [Planctomycetales bacterium]
MVKLIKLPRACSWLLAKSIFVETSAADKLPPRDLRGIYHVNMPLRVFIVLLTALGWARLAAAQTAETIPAGPPALLRESDYFDLDGWVANRGLPGEADATSDTSVVRSPASGAGTQPSVGISSSAPVVLGAPVLGEPAMAEPLLLAPNASVTAGPIVGGSWFDPYIGMPVARGGSDVFGFDPNEPWTLQLLPGALIYKSYLASTKESRLAGKIVHETDDDALWDGTLGGRFAVLRYGNRDPFWPDGWQMDIEASAQIRLDIPEDVDVRSTDYRVGVPLTWGVGRQRAKFAYYHVSSHLGDEFLLKNPNYPRLNFARDVLVLGYTYYLWPSTSVYAEAGWAFFSDVSEQWEFQFGLDYAPALPTGIVGAPFFAANVHLRQELDYSGPFTVQAGWAWRSANNGQLLRIGLHYLNGPSNQYSFYRRIEDQIALGIWYDF